MILFKMSTLLPLESVSYDFTLSVRHFHMHDMARAFGSRVDITDLEMLTAIS